MYFYLHLRWQVLKAGKTDFICRDKNAANFAPIGIVIISSVIYKHG